MSQDLCPKIWMQIRPTARHTNWFFSGVSIAGKAQYSFTKGKGQQQLIYLKATHFETAHLEQLGDTEAR